MADMPILEPGSLDLDTINLRVGGIKTSERPVLERGNKFVVVEHFVGPDGEPIDETRFDTARMCYSLFVAPELNDRWGRHRYVLGHHRSEIKGNTGRTVGGGLLKVDSRHRGKLDDYSVDFRAEPQEVRQKLADLLGPQLKVHLGEEAVTMAPPYGSLRDLNNYWLRFRQILEQVQELYPPQVIDELLGTYRKEEEYYERQLPS